MTSLLCQQCSGSVYVEGYPAGVPYVCPYCRGAMPPRAPSPVEADLRDQLAAVTAERDKAISDKNHLADGLAHALGMDPGHPLPCSMLASVRIIVAAADAAREERSRLAADLTALREAVTGLLGAIQGADCDPVAYCDGCFSVATTTADSTFYGRYAYCDQHREPGQVDAGYAPAWRRLVSMVRPPEPARGDAVVLADVPFRPDPEVWRAVEVPPEPDPGPVPGTVAWFDKARADLAAEGVTVDAADWLIGPDED